MVEGPCLDEFNDSLVPPKALPLTCYRHKVAHNIGPWRTVRSCPEKSTWCPEKSTRCPRNYRLVCCCEFLPADKAAISRAPGRLFMAPGRLLSSPGTLFRAQPGRFSGHNLAFIWTQGAQYLEHPYACSRSMAGPWEANKVLLKSSENCFLGRRPSKDMSVLVCSVNDECA